VKKIIIIIVLIFATNIFPASSLEYEILGSIPHNPESFTQGLLIIGDKIYESTGSVGRGSYVIITDKKTGNEIKAVKADGIFGEGLAFDGTMLWQLSWQEEKAFVYSFNSLNKVAEVSYKGEGWGLTYIPKERLFAMSNGSSQITFRDQEFNETHKISVKMNKTPIDKLNELEFWNGKVLANRWYSDTIFLIDTHTGEVENFIDLTKIRKSENPRIRESQMETCLTESPQLTKKRF
jgi:glutamine cyclotransferase